MVSTSEHARWNNRLSRLAIIVKVNSNIQKNTNLFWNHILLECKQILGTPPYGRLKASSTLPLRKKQSCQPNDGFLLSNKGWCARRRHCNFNKTFFKIKNSNFRNSIMSTLSRRSMVGIRCWSSNFSDRFGN